MHRADPDVTVYTLRGTRSTNPGTPLPHPHGTFSVSARGLDINVMRIVDTRANSRSNGTITKKSAPRFHCVPPATNNRSHFFSADVHRSQESVLGLKRRQPLSPSATMLPYSWPYRLRDESSPAPYPFQWSLINRVSPGCGGRLSSRCNNYVVGIIFFI